MMFENLKEGDPVRIGELVIKVSVIDSEYGYQFQQDGNYFAMFSPKELELMGATLVKEPRTMPVDEFPEGVKFNTPEGVLKWTRRMGPEPGGYIEGLWLENEQGDTIFAERDLLKSTGTEVL